MFRVGVIYGPSGCGKSSLVKAGLLPRLSDPVLRVYVEATPDQTESDLLKRIRWKCPDLPPELGLVETLAALHDGRGLPPGRKLLLVIDQFEQWLVANRGREDTDLVKALGHCDEERVRAILMVRDDFLSARSNSWRRSESNSVPGSTLAESNYLPHIMRRRCLQLSGKQTGYSEIASQPNSRSLSLKPSKPWLFRMA